MNEPILEKAMTTLEFLSQDAEARRQYDMRQKALHDEASMLAGAREEGESTGEYKKAKEVALKLLNKGMGLDMTAEVSGLSLEEVRQLQNTLH